MEELATLLVNRSAIIHNIQAVQAMIGSENTLIPVVKANMYGIGIKNIIEIFNSLDLSIIAVAHIAEAIALRKWGYEGEILVLIQPSINQITEIIDKDISVCCGDIDFMLACQSICHKKNQIIKLQIEIDIGMGRTGLAPNDLDKLISQVSKCKNIIIDGVFTHIPDCSNHVETIDQLSLFESLVLLLKNRLPSIRYVHSLATSGILRYSTNHNVGNAVRSGLAILGYYPKGTEPLDVSLIPSITLKTQIVSCKKRDKGTRIGYNRYCLQRDSMLAVIPIGFADVLIGYDAPGGYVVIKNQKAEVLSICMDTMIVDITDIYDACVGDDVYIWDNAIVTLDNWGDNCNSSIYEVIALLSDRISRIVT